MSSLPSDTCLECGSVIDTAVLGGVCPGCLLGDVIGASDLAKCDLAFDGHELLGEIARGGMGVVYRARQLEPERVVALKTLRGASLDSVEARARFKHEAEVMVSLDHPAILPVHHFGEEDGIPFFTMKLADGGTLAQKMERFSSQWREIAALMITLCDAVRHAHERGVLHRDLKPGNVLFDAAGQAYVSDFGIAKLTDRRDAMTLTMSVLGTPHYLAPEVAHRGPKAASVSSDVWSLGVILFELLTGRRPFEGESVTMILRVLDANDAPSVSTLRKDVPRDLAVITGKALQREPAQRYASAHELADDLRAWLEGRPIKARTVPWHERAWLWSRRNPLQAGLAMMLGLALIAAVASLVFGLRAARRETQRVSAAQAETQQQLLTALLNQAHAGRVSREMGWRKSGIEALRRANAIQPGDNVRDELVAHLAGYDLVPRERTYADIVLPSSSLKHCIRTNNDTTAMSVAKLDDLSNLFDLPDPYSGRTTTPLFAPDDRWVVVGTKVGVRAFSMTGKHEQLAHWPDSQLIGASADCTLIHLGNDTRWRMIETATWKEIASGDAGSLTKDIVKTVPAFHHDPAVPLCAVADGGEVRVIDWRTGADVQRFKPVRAPQSHRWSGANLIIGCGDMGHVFDYRRGREVFFGPGFSAPQYLQAAGGETELLASSELRQTALWHMHSGQRLVSGRGFTAMTLADDGEHFMGRLPRSEVGRIVRPTVMQFLPEALLRGFTKQWYRALALSPDGRLLALHDRTQIVVHEVESGRLIARKDTVDAIALGFSSDGKTLLVLNAAGLEGWTLGRTERRLTLSKAFDVPAPKGRIFLSGRMLQDGERFLAATQKLKPYNELYRLWRDKLKWERQPAPEVTSASITDVSPDGVYNIGGQNQYNVVNNIKELRFILLEQENMKNALGGFSPDGKQLVMVDVTYGWKLYGEDAWKRPEMKVKPGYDTVKNSGAVSTSQLPAWAKSGRWFAASPDGKRVSLVDAASQRVHLTLESPIDLMIDTMLVSEDERTLVLQRRGGTIEVWHLEKLLRELAALGVAGTLPSPPATKPTPPELTGEFDEIALPPWGQKWVPQP